MDSNMTETLAPALSAAGGAAAAGALVMLMVKSWFRKIEDWGKLLQALMIQATRIEERISNLQKTEERTHAQDKQLAVMESKLDSLRGDINGLGHKVRQLAPT